MLLVEEIRTDDLTILSLRVELPGSQYLYCLTVHSCAPLLVCYDNNDDDDDDDGGGVMMMMMMVMMMALSLFHWTADNGLAPHICLVNRASYC